MASLKSTAGGGSDRILNKLRKSIEDGHFYEAHQMYRTLYFRYLNSQKYKELERLLFDGATLLLNRSQAHSGADLALLFIDVLTKNPLYQQEESSLRNVEVDDIIVGKIVQLYESLPAKSPERLNFIQAALKLSPKSFNVPLIHLGFGQILWGEGNYPEARFHFLRSSGSGHDSGHDCAYMLIEFHSKFGYPSEVDLFIAQFVMQLLCLASINPNPPANSASPPPWILSRAAPNSSMNSSTTSNGSSSNQSICPTKLKEAAQEIGCESGRSSRRLDARLLTSKDLASETLQVYAWKHPAIKKDCPPFIQPLLNFLWFLLLAIETGKVATFKTLCDHYSSSLNRDPSYKDYIQRIGELYFGLAPPRQQAPGGFLGNLIQSLMDEDDEEEEDEESYSNLASSRNKVPRTGSSPANASQGSKNEKLQEADLD